MLGRLEPGRLGKDRSDLSYQRFFVSKQGLTGVPLADLPMPDGVPIQILHVRRYDVDIVPSPDLMLEIGDRVGVLVAAGAHRRRRARFFGDTVKSAAEFSYVSVGLGMVLGVLLGLVPIPVPGVGTVTLGIGGGPLIVALIVGRLRRTGPISWVMPLPANIVLRNFGLTLFLATVGINSGQAFVTTVAADRPLHAADRRRVVLTDGRDRPAGRPLPAAHPVRRPAGRRLGRHGQSRHPGLCHRMAPTERPDIGYAMIFPSATIVKVIAVQIVGLLSRSAADGPRMEKPRPPDRSPGSRGGCRRRSPRRRRRDGVAKAGQDAVTLLMLGVLGGAFIAFGAIFSNVALTGAEARCLSAWPGLLAGLVFALGLGAGAAGRGADLHRRRADGDGLGQRAAGGLRVLRAWGLVWIGNLAGAVGTASLVLLAGHHLFGGGPGRVMTRCAPRRRRRRCPSARRSSSACSATRSSAWPSGCRCPAACRRTG